MALESTFEITIFGKILLNKKFIDLTKWLKSTVKKLDPDLKADEYHFIDIGYRIVFTGKPVFLEKIDTVQSSIRRYAKIYLSKWEYKIIVRYREEL